MLCSDTFPIMPIKHLRRGCFVTHLKRMICYALTITAKHEYIEIFNQILALVLSGYRLVRKKVIDEFGSDSLRCFLVDYPEFGINLIDASHQNAVDSFGFRSV